MSRPVKIVAGIVVALVALRAALPWILETGINRALRTNEALEGRVGSVDLELWRGAYQLHDLTLARREPAGSANFLDAKLIDFSVDWKALFHGRLLAKGNLTKPVIDLEVMPKSNEEKAKDEAGDVAKSVMPVNISEIRIEDGVMRFPAAPPESAIGQVELREINGTAKNLRVTEDPSNKTPTSVDLTARTPGKGMLAVKLTYDPFSDPVNFDVDAQLEDIDLPALNPMLRKAADIDVQSGVGNIYAEAKAADGNFRGYVKPLLKDLNVLGGDEKDSLGQKVKEGLADAVKGLIKNHPRDSVGVRVPFEGKFENPKIGVWRAVGTVLRHAFIRALTPKVEGRI